MSPSQPDIKIKTKKQKAPVEALFAFVQRREFGLHAPTQTSFSMEKITTMQT